MIHLGTIELSGPSASVIFEAIPQTYRELIFIIEARSDGTAASRWNPLISSVGPNTTISITGTSGRAIAGGAGAVSNSLSTAETYGLNIINMPRYASNVNKSFTCQFGQPNANGGAAIGFATGRTTAIVTQVTFTNGGGSNFVAGSRFAIYAL